MAGELLGGKIPGLLIALVVTLAWSALLASIVSADPPSVPTPASPENGAIVDTSTPTFTWGASTDPENDPITYWIQVDGDNAFSSPEIDQGGISENTYKPTTALTDGVYYWRVRASDNENSDWSTVGSFTVSTVPPLITGLRLTAIGLGVVFSILFGLEIVVRVAARIWGPKAPQPPSKAPEAPPEVPQEKMEGEK